MFVAAETETDAVLAQVVTLGQDDLDGAKTENVGDEGVDPALLPLDQVLAERGLQPSGKFGN